jgi:Holliday junction resolvase
MTPEGKIQKSIRLKLQRDGWLVIKLMMCSLSGVPDLMCIKAGRIVFIEVKRPDGGKLSEIQKFRIQQMQDMGCEVYVMDSLNQLYEIGIH